MYTFGLGFPHPKQPMKSFSWCLGTPSYRYFSVCSAFTYSFFLFTTMSPYCRGVYLYLGAFFINWFLRAQSGRRSCSVKLFCSLGFWGAAVFSFASGSRSLWSFTFYWQDEMISVKDLFRSKLNIIPYIHVFWWFFAFQCLLPIQRSFHATRSLVLLLAMDSDIAFLPRHKFVTRRFLFYGRFTSTNCSDSPFLLDFFSYCLGGLMILV